MRRRIASSPTIAYLHHASQDDGRLVVELRQLRMYCRGQGRELSHVLFDVGRERCGCRHALEMVRDQRDAVLLLPALAHLTRDSAEFVELVAEYFFRPQGPVLVALRDRFDSRTDESRLLVSLMRRIDQPEVNVRPLGTTLH